MRLRPMNNPVLPKYRITVFHPKWYQRMFMGKDLQVSLEKHDGRRKEYVPVALVDVGVRDVSGTNKS